MAVDFFGRPIAAKQQFKSDKPGGVGRTRPLSEIKTRIELGDCLEIIPRLVDEGVVCDAVVTDPPYHLTSTLARFGKIDVDAETVTSKRLKSKSDAAARLAHGFMNQKWDGGDVAFRPETWATIATILRPGGFLVAFGGTRTHHRVWCAIEDAGFIIQDTIAWLFGSGFPKRKDTLKPAFEPIVLAYKPGGNRTLQVDECRIVCEKNEVFSVGKTRKQVYKSYAWERPHRNVEKDKEKLAAAAAAAAALGRYPANVCHDGSDEVLSGFPVSDSGPPADLSGFRKRQSGFGLTGGIGGFGDTGSTARFFFSAKRDAEDRWDSKHPTIKPLALMRWLVCLVVPEGGTVLDPFAGTGSTGAAALLEGVDSILIEREVEYVSDMRRKLDHFRNKRVRTLY